MNTDSVAPYGLTDNERPDPDAVDQLLINVRREAMVERGSR